MKLGWWWLVVVPVAVLGSLDLAGDWLFGVRTVPSTPRAEPPAAPEARRAFAEWKGPGHDPTADEFADLLRAIGTAAAAGRTADVVEAFDVSCLHDAIAQADFFTTGGRRPDPIDGPRLLRTALWSSAHEWGPALAFDRVEVRSVVALPADAARLVYAKHGSGSRSAPFRWWFTRTATGWKVYDAEELRVGMRLSRQAAGLFARATGVEVPADVLAGLQALRTASDRLGEGDAAAADTALAPARKATLPREAFVLRCVLEGAVAAMTGRAADALAWADRADAVSPGLPAVLYLRASAHAVAADWPRAALNARLYLDHLGPDAAACRILGTALREMMRPAEAAAAFEQGLRDDPTRQDLKAALAELRTKP